MRIATGVVGNMHFPANGERLANHVAGSQRETGRIETVLETPAGINRVLAGRQAKLGASAAGVNDARPYGEISARLGSYGGQSAMGIQHRDATGNWPKLVRLQYADFDSCLVQRFLHRPRQQTDFANANVVWYAANLFDCQAI